MNPFSPRDSSSPHHDHDHDHGRGRRRRSDRAISSGARLAGAAAAALVALVGIIAMTVLSATAKTADSAAPGPTAAEPVASEQNTASTAAPEPASTTVGLPAAEVFYRPAKLIRPDTCSRVDSTQPQVVVRECELADGGRLRLTEYPDVGALPKDLSFMVSPWTRDGTKGMFAADRSTGTLAVRWYQNDVPVIATVTKNDWASEDDAKKWAAGADLRMEKV